MKDYQEFNNDGQELFAANLSSILVSPDQILVNRGLHRLGQIIADVNVMAQATNVAQVLIFNNNFFLHSTNELAYL